MGQTLALSRNFDQGFVSDTSRDELGPAQAYRMKDWIPQLDAPLRKRGGWSYGSPDLSGLGGTAASVATLGYLPFPDDGHVIAVSNGGSVYQLKRFDGSGGALVTDTGDTSIIPSWPIFYHVTGTKKYGIILGGLSQAGKVPKRYYDTTGAGAYQSQALGGTPPLARFGFSWGDYLVLGNWYDPSAPTPLITNSLGFRGVGNPDSWTLSGASASTFGFPEEIVAGVPLLNTQLIFGYTTVYSLTGDTPPPGGNLVRKPLFQANGTFDGRSVAAWRSYAIWANASGVFSSDGATFTDLTKGGGISNYYRSLVSGFAFSQGWSAVAQILYDRYVLTIRNASGALVTTLVCDLDRKVWTEWTNIPAANFAHRPSGPGTSLFGGGEELFAAHMGLPRIITLSGLFSPASANAADADGNPVLPSLETPFYNMGNTGLKRIRNLYVSYDIRTAGASPLLRASALVTPESGASYSTLTPDLITTTKQRRAPVGVRKVALGVGLKITQVGASADTRIYGIEAEGHAQERSR
jgi:hypothetical protein